MHNAQPRPAAYIIHTAMLQQPKEFVHVSWFRGADRGQPVKVDFMVPYLIYSCYSVRNVWQEIRSVDAYQKCRR